MKREYKTGVSAGVDFFTGVEIENTQFKGQKTLFIAKTPSIFEIEQILKKETDIKHIYLGANHFFHTNEYTRAVPLVGHLINQLGLNVTFDISYFSLKTVSDQLSGFLSDDRFCLMVSLKFPNIMSKPSIRLKIDDVGFKASNPGVWVFSANDLPVQSFNDWSKYQEDTKIDE